MAMYFMIFTTGQVLKLLSFHHVLYDNRKLIERVNKVKREQSLADMSTQYNVNLEIIEAALKYPSNVTLKHYCRFLCAPTCCY